MSVAVLPPKLITSAMKSILIAYASESGQTTKIANAMTDQLHAAGISVELMEVRDGNEMPSKPLREFTGAIVGGPIYIGKFSQTLIEWTKKNHMALNAFPAALFSVSLNAADKRPEARVTDRELLERFCTETGLVSPHVASLAGCLDYPRYGFFKRLMMRRISRSAGGPTDMSRAHEMTDWGQVRQFVSDLIATISPGEMLKFDPVLVGANRN